MMIVGYFMLYSAYCETDGNVNISWQLISCHNLGVDDDEGVREQLIKVSSSNDYGLI